jgi:hypothetical protein
MLGYGKRKTHYPCNPTLEEIEELELLMTQSITVEEKSRTFAQNQYGEFIDCFDGSSVGIAQLFHNFFDDITDLFRNVSFPLVLFKIWVW